MAKKEIINENKTLMTLEDIMSDRFSRYSKYIIQERALPDARDGLKPVQRRILYAMYKEGNVSTNNFRKSAKTVGIVIGNYHPHGDSSVYEAMVRLSQDWKVNHQLVDMHGNNGSIDDDPPAAMRYTEARLAKISMTLLKDLDYNTVLMAPNFDDTENEPTVLPSQFPLLLVNGATGIAAGYATNIAPCNLNEVIDACIYCIRNKNVSIDDLLEIVHGPDFPTGAIVQGKEQIKNIYQTGKGRVVVRSRTSIEETKTVKQIIITEIPYEVVKSNLVKKIDEIRINKELDGIMDVRDESDRNGLRIVIDLKKDVDHELVLNYLYKNTDLQTYYNYNMVAIINKRPKVCSLLDLLNAFIDFRKETVLKRSKFLLNQISSRLNVLEGLIKAISIMDEIISIIRSSNDKKDAKNRLIEAYLFNEEQAEAIVNLRLYRLTNTDINELRNEFAELVNKMEELKAIIENEKILNSVIINELKAIKKEYGRPRRTTIEDEISEIVIDKMKMISNDPCVVTVSMDGYIKRVSPRSFNENQMTKVKEGDQFIGYNQSETLDTLLLFTNKGNYAFVPVYEINEAKWKDLGDHLNNYVNISSDEKIINAVIVKNFDTKAYIISITKGGMIKKTSVKDYVVTRYSKMIKDTKLKSEDEVVKVIVAYPNDELMVCSKDGFLARYNENTISAISCKSQGVKAINLAKGDSLSSITTIHHNQSLVVLFDSGKIKRIRNNDISESSRTNKGERIIKKFKTNNPEVIDILGCNIYDNIELYDTELKTLAIKDIPLMSKEASFSSPIALEKDFYLIKNITEVKVIDYDETSEEIKEEILDDNVYMEKLL